jgi:hypothetical protein
VRTRYPGRLHCAAGEPAGAGNGGPRRGRLAGAAVRNGWAGPGAGRRAHVCGSGVGGPSLVGEVRGASRCLLPGTLIRASGRGLLAQRKRASGMATFRDGRAAAARLRWPLGGPGATDSGCRQRRGVRGCVRPGVDEKPRGDLSLSAGTRYRNSQVVSRRYDLRGRLLAMLGTAAVFAPVASRWAGCLSVENNKHVRVWTRNKWARPRLGHAQWVPSPRSVKRNARNCCAPTVHAHARARCSGHPRPGCE